jgi:hypothetical protein
MHYSVFAKGCVDELKLVQDKFRQDYDVDWYDNWFYRQETGLLTFSTGDAEINFRYFEAGTFSLKSNTWMWAWDNEYTIDKIKEPCKRIKEFGHRSGYTKLTQACFPSDETEAWEFTAIAAKLGDGIGVYRPVDKEEQLQIYMILTEALDQETAQEIKDRFVACDAHDYRRAAFVCQHLNPTTKVGFVEAFETAEGMELDDDDDLQAWCNQCETVRQAEGEWNDTSMAAAQIKIVCEQCYFEMKELNLGYK